MPDPESDPRLNILGATHDYFKKKPPKSIYCWGSEIIVVAAGFPGSKSAMAKDGSHA